MTRFDSLLKIFARMITYGVVLGAIAGFLVGFVLLLFDPYSSPNSDFFNQIIGAFILSLIYGSFFGGMYGGASGFVSGLAMTVVTAIGYATVRNLRNYKIVMGAITAFVTSGIFFGFGLWDMVGGNSDMDMAWFSALAMSVVIAVYASQIIARKYVNEMTVRKAKAK